MAIRYVLVFRTDTHLPSRNRAFVESSENESSRAHLQKEKTYGNGEKSDESIGEGGEEDEEEEVEPFLAAQGQQ